MDLDSYLGRIIKKEDPNSYASPSQLPQQIKPLHQQTAAGLDRRLPTWLPWTRRHHTRVSFWFRCHCPWRGATEIDNRSSLVGPFYTMHVPIIIYVLHDQCHRAYKVVSMDGNFHVYTMTILHGNLTRVIVLPRIHSSEEQNGTESLKLVPNNIPLGLPTLLGLNSAIIPKHTLRKISSCVTSFLIETKLIDRIK